MIISDHLVLALASDRQRDLRDEAAAVRLARLAPRRIRFGRVRIGVLRTLVPPSWSAKSVAPNALICCA